MFFSDFVNGQGRKNFQQKLGKKENLFFAGIVWSQVLFAPFEFLVIHPFAAALFVLTVFNELIAHSENEFVPSVHVSSGAVTVALRQVSLTEFSETG